MSERLCAVTGGGPGSGAALVRRFVAGGFALTLADIAFACELARFSVERAPARARGSGARTSLARRRNALSKARAAR